LFNLSFHNIPKKLKLICGPLWRILEDQSISFFEMNDYWQILVEKFEEFSNDRQ
jgi:hypothetical protein